MTARLVVLCVLTEEQQSEYKAELSRFELPEVELVRESDPEAGLDLIGERKPDLAIVGMDLGAMEGLEFMALMLNRYKDFEHPLVVLPSKNEKLLPVIHTRSKTSGRSSVEASDFEQILGLIGLAPNPQPLSLVPFDEPGAGGDLPSDFAEPDVPPLANIDENDLPSEPAGRQRSWKVPAIGVGALVAIGLVAALLITRGDSSKSPETPTAVAPAPDQPSDAPAKPAPMLAASEGSRATDTPAAPPKTADGPAQPATPPAAPNATEGLPAPAKPADAPENREPEVAPPEKPAVASPETGEKVLPVIFNKGEGKLQITDQALMDQLVREMKARSGARILLTGHTSAEGPPKINEELGLYRARKVQEYLVRRGIPESRIELQSAGAIRPKASGKTEDERASSRRVTLQLTQ